MAPSSNLFRLQQIDTLNDQTMARLEELEKILNDRTLISQAEEIYKKAEADLQDERKKLNQAENIVRDQRMKIEQDESSLYSGKMHNPKELQDLQKEVASLKKFLSTLEDRQLEIMIKVEEAEGVSGAAKDELDQVQGRMVEQNAQFAAEKSRLLKDKDRLGVERQAAYNALTSQEQDLYNQLRITRRGIAVARIVDRTCTACGSTLTPALVQTANSPSQISRCPSCGRILYPG